MLKKIGLWFTTLVLATKVVLSSITIRWDNALFTWLILGLSGHGIRLLMYASTKIPNTIPSVWSTTWISGVVSLVLVMIVPVKMIVRHTKLISTLMEFSMDIQSIVVGDDTCQCDTCKERRLAKEEERFSQRR